MRSRIALAVALAAAATTTLLANETAAFAAYDQMSCTAPAGYHTCWTGALQPHSTQHWLRVLVNRGDGRNVYALYDVSSYGLVSWCQGYGTGGWTTCYNLDPSHYYELEVGSGSSSATGYVANYT